MSTGTLKFKDNEPIAVYLSKKSAPSDSTKIRGLYVSKCNIELAMERLAFLIHQAERGKISDEVQEDIATIIRGFIDPDHEDSFHLLLIPFGQWSKYLF